MIPERTDTLDEIVSRKAILGNVWVDRGTLFNCDEVDSVFRKKRFVDSYRRILYNFVYPAKVSHLFTSLDVRNSGGYAVRKTLRVRERPNHKVNRWERQLCLAQLVNDTWV